MTVEDVGREGLRLVSQLTDAAVAMPVAAGYVALGAAVLVGGSLLDVARQTWDWLPSLGPRPREQETRRHRAA